MRYMGGTFHDPEVPAGYQDADLEMRRLREHAERLEREEADDQEEDDGS